MLRIRYQQGVVGESQRVVHVTWKVPPGDVLRALCGRDFLASDVESCDDSGMPCMQCIARAAIANHPSHLDATTAGQPSIPNTTANP